MERRSPSAFVLATLSRTGGLAAGGIVATLATGFVFWTWKILDRSIGTAVSAMAMGLTILVVASIAASKWGVIDLPWLRGVFHIWYGLRMIPYWLLEALRGGSPGNGRENQRFESTRGFESDCPKRGEGDQLDIGVHWHESGDSRGHRVSWIPSTEELVAVGRGGLPDGTVEVIGKIPSEFELDRRLKNWAHASFGGATLAWVRRRAHGWSVPLPGKARWWLREDNKSPKPWPSPPTPSLDRKVGAYVGWRGDDKYRVETLDPSGSSPLYHFVDSSPTGYSWGYFGSGPWDLAVSLLADRLGYIPQPPVISRFKNEVIGYLDDEFVLTFQDVDGWIDKHAALFARFPHAQPFDPFAAGGAY